MIQGHLIFEGINCFYTKLEHEMIIIPEDINDYQKIYKFDRNQNFFLSYEEQIYKNSYVYIEKIEPRFNNSLCLNTKYTIRLIGEYEINGFIMLGDEIDIFFSPSIYFYNKKRKGELIKNDLLYGREEVAKYHFEYKRRSIVVTLFFGDILGKGIASDLLLHPKLHIEFDKTKDLNFIFDVYMILIKFLQIVRYQKQYNLKEPELLGATEKHPKSYIGQMYIKPYINKYYNKHSYFNFHILGQENIYKLLQLISKDINFSIRHLPLTNDESYKYDVLRFLSIFSAFEYECEMNKKDFSEINVESIYEIRKKIIKQVDGLNGIILNQIEKKFINDVKNKIESLGTQYGQERKIINAFNKTENIIKDSLKLLFINDFNINKVAKNLSKLRQKIVHNNLNRQLSDGEIKDIRFLEVLTYILFLKRAKVCDERIEIIIGAIFLCNVKFMEFDNIGL